MKKETIILILVIIGLSAYLFFHKENRDNYTLPTIEKIDTAAITALTIKSGSNTVQLDRTDKGWTVTDEKFPADASMVETLLDTLKTFRLTALVAEKGDLTRYELDSENRIQVQALKSGTTAFEFSVGKDAPTFNHTFVMIAGDPNVYHASGAFRNDYEREAKEFRDKLVLEIKKDAVKAFTVTKGDKTKTLIADRSKEKSEGESDSPSVNWQVKGADTSKTKVAYSKKISTFLASISYLKCDTYVADKAKESFKAIDPQYVLTIETDTTHRFELYTGKNGTKNYGISSMNDYVFTLSDFDAEQIMTSMDEFLGIKKPDNKK